METTKVSKRLLKRLPVYLNYLKNLPEDSFNVSATAMAKALNLGDVQVRKDLAKISPGRRRTGRDRNQLMRDIEEYLNVIEDTGTIVVGAGKLGQALLDYTGFEKAGLNVVAGFDADLSKKKTAGGKKIYPITRLEDFCRNNDIRIGILTVPAESAQMVCDAMVACGIKAIWNFTPSLLRTPENVVVQNENLAMSLAALCMQIKDSTETAVQ